MSERVALERNSSKKQLTMSCVSPVGQLVQARIIDQEVEENDGPLDDNDECEEVSQQIREGWLHFSFLLSFKCSVQVHFILSTSRTHTEILLLQSQFDLEKRERVL